MFDCEKAISILESRMLLYSKHAGGSSISKLSEDYNTDFSWIVFSDGSSIIWGGSGEGFVPVFPDEGLESFNDRR